jgi:ABC-type nitrate/sulfonate/bicarbonate transport system permease component
MTSNYKMTGSLKGWIISFLSIAFIFYGVYYCKIPIGRVLTMFPPLARMLSRVFYPPNMGYVTSIDVLGGLWETFEMGFFASLIGTLISLPLAWFAAYNMTPSRRIVYPLARLTIGLSRAINILIWAILFTHIFGFGPLPGVLALVLLTIGFASKLFSEEIEGIRVGPVEAMQATGAGRIQVMYYGVLLQLGFYLSGGYHSWICWCRGNRRLSERNHWFYGVFRYRRSHNSYYCLGYFFGTAVSVHTGQDQMNERALEAYSKPCLHSVLSSIPLSLSAEF